ncbi:flagellar biosynthetic protein FliR [Xanthomonas translucens pv. arrhenatheri]|uniref:Flagellar biosynthetic protein FliR n=2 Tax=Xanthomonas graminis TaxID=3390026 RepID=A0A0K2ZDA1_9XANT|nr:flagellar biosynthetic protein FliR [Xanthomonas translucens]OAX66604.1 flagellar biosynthetic protein FliR [Xanthomonas translucens pv. arrhenatheri]UKE64211.1 flagellar biosynthetic protein FliR [Xanthomonas translucens pv. phlei]UKE75041.1 flagellar biosynthetic protein FliR [Xanthomonas translucens pv. phleipratensis]UKE79328.1 flagellar biosynthetic protein FliR [Xanthomonas translucens pv. arrhenatheri]CTP82672.1 flagellar biosynthetic protein flir [Xanthomonas translucens pv. arrhena
MDSATQMVIDGQRAFAMVGAILWTMLRIGAMLMAMPLVGSRAVPARVRVMLAATLAMALAPLLPPVPDWNGFDAAVVLSVARELAVGASMGFMLRLIFEAGAMAGELVSQSTGLGFAQMADPLRGVTSGVIGQWFYLTFGLLFFTANGHLAVVALLVDSYKALPIGNALPDAQAMASVAPDFFMSMMRGAVTLALPVMVAMLAVNLAFGALAKAAPALNPIQLGLPVAVVLGLALLAVLVGEMGPPVQRLFDAAFDAARQITA